MKTITKNIHVTALTALLIMASFAPHNSWAALQPAARGATLATQRAAQQLYPTLAPAGLTSRGGTPAQASESAAGRAQRLEQERRLARARDFAAQAQKARRAQLQTQLRTRIENSQLSRRQRGMASLNPQGMGQFRGSQGTGFVPYTLSTGSILTRRTGMGLGQQSHRSFFSFLGKNKNQLQDDLMNAIYSFNESKVSNLVHSGADINAVNQRTGKVALVEAAKYLVGGVKQTQVLLKLGSNPNIVDENGMTPLMAVVSGRRISPTQDSVIVADLLIKAGADINYINGQGVSIADKALANGHTDVLQLLIDTGNLKEDFAGKKGGEALLEAIENKDKDMKLIRLLVDQGAPVNTEGMYGACPLHIAAIQGDKAVIALLLEHGANPQARDWYDNTPLDYALWSKDPIDDATFGSMTYKALRRWRGPDRVNPRIAEDIKRILQDASKADKK